MYIIVHNGARIFGGCERWMARTLPQLQARGHRIKVLCNHEIVAHELRARGLDVAIARLTGDLVLTDAVRFAWRLRRERPDIVLFTTFKKIWLGGLAAALARVPRTVLRIGLSTDVPRRLKYRLALHAVDDIIVAAPELKERYGDNVTVIPNGVAVPPVTRDPAVFRAELGIPAEAFVIGTVARLAQQKRIDRLVEVLARLPDHTHAVVAGSGSQQAALERAAERLGVRARLHLLGHRDDVGNVLGLLDCFVICSDLEGMSSAMLEAMAAGLPIVSTPVSGARYALDRHADEAAGLVTRDFAVESIAQAVARVQQSPALRARLSAAARARHRADFELQQMIDRYEAVLFGREP